MGKVSVWCSRIKWDIVDTRPFVHVSSIPVAFNTSIIDYSCRMEIKKIVGSNACMLLRTR